MFGVWGFQLGFILVIVALIAHVRRIRLDGGGGCGCAAYLISGIQLGGRRSFSAPRWLAFTSLSIGNGGKSLAFHAE
jgi:hypothetical protein